MVNSYIQCAWGTLQSPLRQLGLVRRWSKLVCHSASKKITIYNRMPRCYHWLLRLAWLSFISRKFHHRSQYVHHSARLNSFWTRSRLADRRQRLHLQRVYLTYRKSWMCSTLKNTYIVPPQKEWKCPTEVKRFSLRYLARNLLTYICRDVFVEKKYTQ